MSQNFAAPKFARCIAVGEYPASLEAGKSYRVISDDLAATKGFVRIIDESGEDYLYPRRLFAIADAAGSASIERVLTEDTLVTQLPR